MKKFIVIALVVLWVLSGISTSGYTLRKTGDWYKTYCALCNKVVYEWIEWDNNGGNYSIISGWNPSCPGEEVWHIGQHKQIQVCKECFDKYKTELESLMEKTFNEWITNKIIELKPIREKFAEEERQELIKENEEKIKELKKKIKKLEAEKQ